MTAAKHAAESFGDRFSRFQDTAQSIPGPLGALFQRIALAQQQYADAAERHGTTVGETARLLGVVVAAMDAIEWLHHDGSAALIDLPLGDWIAEIAGMTTADDVLPGRHSKPDEVA